jgi:hypothetical protein
MNKAFEQWYVENAFDYVKNPIGSRDCALQRAAWNEAVEQCAELIEALDNEWVTRGAGSALIRPLISRPN